MRHIKPKRWISIYGIGIAVTAAIIAATTTASCVFGTTTNFCEQFGLHCKEGQECAAHQAICIDIGGCGDGIIDPAKGEVCDDGNIVDGEDVNGVFVPDSCSHDCKSNQTCGNGHKDMGEDCDDGDRNGFADDACDINCKLKTAFCGNGIVDMNLGEQCDPGPMDSAGCNSNQANNPDHLSLGSQKAGCKFSRCGDGYANTAINPVTMEPAEQCDSGGMNTMDCNGPLCTHPFCGDNFRNMAAGEDCDNGGEDTAGCNGNNNGMQGTGSCKSPRCGDGYANSKSTPAGSTQFEKCDAGGDSPDCNGDGNGDMANNPDAQCQIPRCGDGYINPQFTPPGADDTENCDNGPGDKMGRVDDTPECNGNNKDKNGPGSCRMPTCGDGYTNKTFTPPGSMSTEACDTKIDSDTCNGNGNGSSDNNLEAQCQTPKCGDGYVNTAFTPSGANGPEECDNLGGADTMRCNGNSAGSAACHISRCGDGYMNAAAGEGCDGGEADTKMCNGSNAESAACQPPRCGDHHLNTAAGEECEDGKGCGPNETCTDSCKCMKL